MTATAMTLEQVRVVGYSALLRDLGPVNMVRFLQQFETGHGDYTAGRHQWLDQYTVEEILQEIQKRRGNGQSTTRDD